MFMCNGVHGFDRAGWVVGQKIQSVCAVVEPTTGTCAEDYGAALAKFDGGVQGNFFQHRGPFPVAAMRTADFWRTGHGARTLLGFGGGVDWRPAHHHAFLQARPRHIRPNDAGDGGGAGRDDKLGAPNVAPSVTGEDGRVGLADVLAVYESAATGQWVKITTERTNGERR